MKRLFQIAQFPLFLAFNFFLLLTIYQLVGSPGQSRLLGFGTPVYDGKEDYDPSLQRLNSIEKLATHCDSLYDELLYQQPTVDFEKTYPEIVSAVTRKRFYHGYSTYDLGNNFVAGMVANMSVKGLGAIVLPNDILKYPYAACSQQSIVMMDVLREKGFRTRKVGFKGPSGGHFCFEVFYKGSWHFFDPDMEPDTRVLHAYQRPGIAFLSTHKDVMLQAYHQYPQSKMLDLFSYYWYGKVNAPAAPNAYLFQKISKFLSYTIWTFFLVLFIMVRRKYLRLRASTNVRNHRIRIPELQPGTPGALNLEY